MTRTYIHIGPSKTGTTTLQREIFSRHSQIAYLGKPFYSPGVPENEKKGEKSRLQEDFVLSLRSNDSLQYDEARVVEGVRIHLEKYPPGNRVRVLSEEGLAASGRADRGIIAERLNRAFGTCDVLLTMRNQLTCLPSIFLHYYRRGDFVGLTFDGWLQEDLQSRHRARVYETWKQYDYYSLYKLYRRVFPEGRVKVLLFEQMAGDNHAFSEEISEFLGIDAVETQSLFESAQRLNAGFSLKEADFHRRYQKMWHWYGQAKAKYFSGLDVQKYVPLASKARVIGKQTVKKHFAKERRSTGNPARVSDESIRMIRDYFAESNRKLAQECNLPLADFDYPT